MLSKNNSFVVHQLLRNSNRSKRWLVEPPVGRKSASNISTGSCNTSRITIIMPVFFQQQVVLRFDLRSMIRLRQQHTTTQPQLSLQQPNKKSLVFSVPNSNNDGSNTLMEIQNQDTSSSITKMMTVKDLQKKSISILEAPIGTLTPVILRDVVSTMISWTTTATATASTTTTQQEELNLLESAGKTTERLLKRVLQEDAMCGTSYATSEIYTYAIKCWATTGFPHYAERILVQMEQQLLNTPPSRHCYNTVIDAWVHSKAPEAGERARSVVHRRIKVHPNRTLYDYNMDLTALAKCGDGRQAEELLETMINESRDSTHSSSSSANDARISPNTHSFTSVINAYAKSNLPNADERAEAILSRMQNLYEAGIITARPSVRTFTAVIDALAKGCGTSGKQQQQQSNTTNSMKATSILRHMQELHDSGTYEEPVKPTTITYNAMINVYSHCNDAPAAESMLQRLQQLYEQGDTDVRPDVCSFNSVMHAYAKEGTERGAAKAEAIYRQLQRWSRETNALDLRHNIITANIAIDCWAQCRSKEGAKRAEQLLHEVENDFINGHSDIRANNHTYNSVINGWALSSCHDASAKAEAIFDRMISSFKAGNVEARPTTFTFNTVLKAFSRSCDNNIDAAREAESFFKRIQAIQIEGGEPLLEPDMVSYSTLLDAWSRSNDKGAASRCELILNALEQLCLRSNSHMDLNIAYYNICISALGRSGDKEAGSKAEKILRRVEELQATGYDIQPDLITFNSTLNAWAKSSEVGAASRAEALLRKMERLYEQNKLDFRPNHISYATVINALAKSGEKYAASKAEQLLINMLQSYRKGDVESKPNTISFTSVIDAFSKSSSKDAPKKAEAILRLMESSFLEGNKDAEPNTVSYSAVIDAWSRSGEHDAYERARKIFNEMVALEGSGRSVHRNAITYASLINALARSKTPGKAKQAHKIFKEMEALYKDGNRHVKPNIYVINGVLNACAFTKGSKGERADAMRILMNILDGPLQQYGKPNHITYSIAFQAFSALTRTPEEKAATSTVVHELFRKCCEIGLVDKGVFKKFRKAATEEVYQDLTRGISSSATTEAITFDDLPEEWTCNVGRASRHMNKKPFL